MAGKFVAAVHVCNASGQGSAPVSHYNGVAHEQHIGLAATQTVIQRENGRGVLRCHDTARYLTA